MRWPPGRVAASPRVTELRTDSHRVFSKRWKRMPHKSFVQVQAPHQIARYFVECFWCGILSYSAFWKSNDPNVLCFFVISNHGQIQVFTFLVLFLKELGKKKNEILGNKSQRTCKMKSVRDIWTKNKSLKLNWEDDRKTAVQCIDRQSVFIFKSVQLWFVTSIKSTTAKLIEGHSQTDRGKRTNYF